MNADTQSPAWRLIGSPRVGGILIVGDHASNHIPDQIDLGIADALLQLHIAWDIGVADVARALVEIDAADAAFLGDVSRLVVDFNRPDNAEGVIPLSSDGHALPGNALTSEARAVRIDRYHAPYHAALKRMLSEYRPAMILSLHSFTPRLASAPSEQRPWHVGVLYNQDDRLARIAIPALASTGLCVGDQQPYSGRDLNFTMNHHAEARGIPYLGIEMRQDMVADADGVARMTECLARALIECRNYLAQISLQAE